MIIKDGFAILSTGKKFGANIGTIGIRFNLIDECLEISEGSDNAIKEEFTFSEKQEIAQFMLERWAEWGQITLPRWPG